MDPSTITSKASADDEDCSEIERLFECCICHQGLEDSYLCPHCSTAFCWKCIETWLDTDESCPNCRDGLTEEQLIKARTLDEIQEAVSRLKNAEGRNRCAVHKKEQLSLFCFPCEECICACCLFTESHLEHKDQVVLVAEAFPQYNQKLKDSLGKIKNRQENIVRLMEDTKTNEEGLAKELVRLRTIDQEIKDLCAKATTLLNDGAKDATCLTSIMDLVKATELFDTEELGAGLMKILIKKDTQPEAVTFEFHMENFTGTLNAQKMYESLPQSVAGFTFRLKVAYNDEEEYYDCYLQMEEGVPGEYSVKIQDSDSKRMNFELRKYVESEFELQLDIDEEADLATVTVEIQLAETYAEKCSQLERYIKRLEEKLADNEIFMKYLSDFQMKRDSNGH